MKKILLILSFIAGLLLVSFADETNDVYEAVGYPNFPALEIYIDGDLIKVVYAPGLGNFRSGSVGDFSYIVRSSRDAAQEEAFF